MLANNDLLNWFVCYQNQRKCGLFRIRSLVYRLVKKMQHQSQEFDWRSPASPSPACELAPQLSSKTKDISFAWNARQEHVAPHANSYDRLVPGAHAPTSICWGYDNRTAAIRIPGGSPKARRIEHRLAGGDVSPHLFLAAVLGSALIGIEQKLDAPAPMTGNAYDQDFDQVSSDWAESIEIFANSDLAAEIFDPILIDNLVRTKRQEMQTHEKLTDQERILSYLDRV